MKSCCKCDRPIQPTEYWEWYNFHKRGETDLVICGKCLDALFADVKMLLKTAIQQETCLRGQQQ